MITSIIFSLLFAALAFLRLALILWAIVSTLMAFSILDSRSKLVWTISDFLYRVTDPILRPLRTYLPNLSGVDLSVFVALILIQLVAIPVLVYLERGLEYGVWQSLI